MKKEVLLKDAPRTRVLALGNEAIARGAIEAGMQFVTGYPGTPSTEIMETLIEAAPHLGFIAYWSVNEKVAFDAVTGASFSGVAGRGRWPAKRRPGPCELDPYVRRTGPGGSDGRQLWAASG